MPKTVHANIPMRNVGPILINGWINEGISVPLATYEIPLWPSTNRGARVSREAGGINVVLTQDVMTRSVVFDTDSAEQAHACVASIQSNEAILAEQIASTSRFARLDSIHCYQVGNVVYLRIAIQSGDASGHNMVTKAAESVINWVTETYPTCRYVSISGNVCVDKKVSAINGILGRGKSVVADILIPRPVCEKVLKTTPEAIIDLNLKKNWMGGVVAGSLRSANAHFANILLAFYLATGQDAANIVEGSQGLVHTELRGEDLYFSVTLPNIIVGTVGNGKDLDFVQENLAQLGCKEDRNPGENAKRLAGIIAATVLCGELSLMAAQTNPGELMRSHVAFERQGLQTK